MANDDLRADAKELAALVATLNGSVQGLSGRTRRSEKLIRRVAVSLAASVILAMVIVIGGFQVAREFDCLRSALVARSAASGGTNNAAIGQLKSQDNLVTTLLTGVSTREQSRATLIDYRDTVRAQIATLEKVERARQQNPLSVSEQCG